MPLPIHELAELRDWVSVAHMMIIDNDLETHEADRLMAQVFSNPAAEAIFHECSRAELEMRLLFDYSQEEMKPRSVA